MRMVVLHLQQGQALLLRPLLGVTRSQVIRVQIASQRLGMDAEQLFKMGDAVFEGLQRFIVFHIADVVTEEAILLARQAESVFQLGAGCQ